MELWGIQQELVPNPRLSGHSPGQIIGWVREILVGGSFFTINGLIFFFSHRLKKKRAQSPQHPLDCSDMIVPRLVIFLTTMHLVPCQMVSEEAAVPAPTLSVLQGQKEYFFGDVVTLVCTTPRNITGKLMYQIFGDGGWAISGFSSTNNYTFEFVLSRMQHRGPHFCSYSIRQGLKQLISPTSEELVIKIGDHRPQPLLMVESPQGEVMAGELLSIICKAPGNVTIRRFHFYRDGQEVLPVAEGSEDNAADHGGSLRTSMVLQFPRAGPQHSGNFTCKYEEKKPERWIPSFTSQAVSISVNPPKKGKSCFFLLRLLVVGGCFLTINSLILLFFWARGRSKDASFLYGASPAGISQLDARSPYTLQEDNKYEEH
ncbi:immunoglobulin superfamily member 1-like [Aix galericulata]|nr:immunoglobulin superfamily member 1-like [Aix galericulata]